MQVLLLLVELLLLLEGVLLLVHHHLFMGIIAAVFGVQRRWNVVRVFRQEMRENGIRGGVGNIIVVVAAAGSVDRGKLRWLLRLRLWGGYLVANLGRSCWRGNGLCLDRHLSLIQSQMFALLLA